MDTISMPLPTGPTAQGLARDHTVLQPNLHLSQPARHRTHQPIRTGTRHRKTPRREHTENILWHKSFHCFLRSVSQGNRNKNKNKQRRPNQTYKHSRGNHKQDDNLQNRRKYFPMMWLTRTYFPKHTNWPNSSYNTKTTHSEKGQKS